MMRLAVAGLLVGSALLAACSSTSQPAPAKTVTVIRTVTATPSPSAAAGPLRQPEACTPVETGADGNVGPVTCPDGHPNAYAMPALQATAPRMMGLGEFATPAVIQAAACADLASDSTFPIEESAYKFAKALNGWSFGVDPTNGGIFTFCG
jgi:hypothetical protein